MMYTLCLFTQLDPGFGVTFSVVKGVLPSVARCRIPEIVVIHMVNSSRMLSNIPCKFIIDFIESLYNFFFFWRIKTHARERGKLIIINNNKTNITAIKAT